MHDRGMGRGRPKKQDVAPGQAGSCALSVLRSTTKEAHEALEAHIPLLHPRVDAQQYHDYLLAIGPVVQALEAVVSRSEDDLASRQYLWAPRRRFARLQADVAVLAARADVRPRDAQVWPDTAPSSGQLAAHDTQSARIGMLYVLEGSTLGGQLLRKNLADKLHVNSTALRYLSGHGQNTAKMWQQTQAVVESFLRTDEQRKEAAQAAVAVFVWFDDAIATVA